MQSAWLNVLINLKSLKDQEFADECCRHGQELMDHAIPIAKASYKKVEALILEGSK